MAAIDVNPEGLAGFDPPHNAIGHQGLFFERFFAAAGESLLTDPPLTVADPAAGVPAGLYHNRNRWYSPSLGRFTTRDPHASGLVPLHIWGALGVTEQVALSFDAQEQFVDGLNLYGYARFNPGRYVDPAGGFTMELAAIGGFILGDIAAHCALNDGKVPLSMMLLGVTGAEAWVNKRMLPSYLKPSVGLGNWLGENARKYLPRLMDWASKRSWAQRLVRNASSETVSSAVST